MSETDPNLYTADHLDFAIRDGGPQDWGFIYATWLRSYKHASEFGRKIRNGVYFREHHDVIERILDRASIRIAHATGEPDVILGYSVFEQGVPVTLHYFYVKSSFRGFGIGRALLGTIDLNTAVVTHRTFVADEILRQYPGSKYTPYF